MEDEVLKLVKMSCNVSENSTAKDEEFKMLIGAAEEDMSRLGIKVDHSKKKVKHAICLYAKGHWGFTKIEEQKKSLESYDSLVKEMSLSGEYREYKE